MATDRLHILVVDDNEEILNMMQLLLTLHDCKVSTQIRFGNFIHEVKQIMPDCIIIDKHLGWADGADLCAHIKTHTDLQHICVIMLSAYHNFRDSCLFAGADAFIEKPFDLNHLLDTVQQCSHKGNKIGPTSKGLGS